MISSLFWRLAGVFSGADDAAYKNVTAEEAKEMLAEGEDLLVLDVRTPEEYAGPLGRIPGAVLLPVNEIPARLGELEKHKNRKLLVVCRSGVRSVHAGRFLAKNGFKEVYNVSTGMAGMNRSGAPLEFG